MQDVIRERNIKEAEYIVCGLLESFHHHDSRPMPDGYRTLCHVQRYINLNRYTTAQLRNMAKDAEIRLNWQEAAMFWYLAAANYPEQLLRGQLGKDDVAAMQLRADACKCSAELIAERAADYDPLDDFNYVGSRHHY